MYIQDFPSVNQIRQVLTENTIVPIFAVTEENVKIFNDISTLLEGTNAATVAISDDSNDIINVIQTAYEVERGKEERGTVDLIIKNHFLFL